ncbi:hypothetical protein [Yoonia sp.]|uniref:hypothetical protein n=1 Tax=Yoonia sp. TaxID=2212373 RepID=UPI003975184D
MSFNLIIGILAALILAAFVLRAINIVISEKGEVIRGSDKKTGFHVIHAEYSSGISGHHTTYKVPCDPQQYAQLFSPQETETKK